MKVGTVVPSHAAPLRDATRLGLRCAANWQDGKR